MVRGSGARRSGNASSEANTQFLHEIYSLPGGERISACNGCGDCSTGCPNSQFMTVTPGQIVPLVQSGKEQELFDNDAMWYCAACCVCTAQCPLGIPVADIIGMLRGMALKKGFHAQHQRSAALVSSFMRTVGRNGRNHEAALFARYYSRTRLLGIRNTLPLGLKLWARHRLPLRGGRVKASKEFRAVIAKARELRRVA